MDTDFVDSDTDSVIADAEDEDEKPKDFIDFIDIDSWFFSRSYQTAWSLLKSNGTG